MFSGCLSRLCFLLFLLGLFSPTGSWAQHIALLISSDAEAYQRAAKSIHVGVGSQATVRDYHMGGDAAEGRILAERIRVLAPDVVVAIGLKAALAAKREIVDTPVVFCMVLYPAQYGLPTSNMYGIAMDAPVEKQLSTLIELIPNLRRVGVLYDPDRNQALIKIADHQAKPLKLALDAVPVSSEDHVPGSLRQLLPRVDVLWLLRDPTVVNSESLPYILETALEHNVPVFGFSAGLVRHGAIASLSPDYHALGLQAGKLAVKLLHVEVPFAQSTRLVNPDYVGFALNLRTAELLRIVAPPRLVQMAQTIYRGTPSMVAEDHPLKLDESTFIVR